MIAVGSDHVGLQLKAEIINHLKDKGIEVLDFGCFDIKRTNYPVFAYKVAVAVAKGDCEKGLLFCGTGVGM